jgi:hypothetical protein
MGRNVKRIDLKFDWFERAKLGIVEKTWKGYIIDLEIICPLCNGDGKNLEGENCPLCYGEKRITPQVEPPFGEGWQMWEDTSEGSPISPVCKSAKELAKWLEDNGASAMGSQTATKSEWLAMIKIGSAPSGIMMGDGTFLNGVEAAEKLKVNI